VDTPTEIGLPEFFPCSLVRLQIYGLSTWYLLTVTSPTVYLLRSTAYSGTSSLAVTLSTQTYVILRRPPNVPFATAPRYPLLEAVYWHTILNARHTKSYSSTWTLPLLHRILNGLSSNPESAQHTISYGLPCKSYPPSWIALSSQVLFELTYDLASTPLQIVSLTWVAFN